MKRVFLILISIIMILTIFAVGKGAKKVFSVTAEKCIGCTICVQKCPTKAIEMKDGKAIIDTEKCINCGICENVCPTKAISQETAVSDSTKKTTETSNETTKKESVIKKVFNVIEDKCIGCTLCVKECPTQAIKMVDRKAVIDVEKCIGCGLCQPKCPVKAIEPNEIEVKDK